jgi:hypothetical protein
MAKDRVRQGSLASYSAALRDRLYQLKYSVVANFRNGIPLLMQTGQADES